MVRAGNSERTCLDQFSGVVEGAWSERNLFREWKQTSSPAIAFRSRSVDARTHQDPCSFGSQRLDTDFVPRPGQALGQGGLQLTGPPVGIRCHGQDEPEVVFLVLCQVDQPFQGSKIVMCRTPGESLLKTDFFEFVDQQCYAVGAGSSGNHLQNCAEVRGLLPLGYHAATLPGNEVSIFKVWFPYGIRHDANETMGDLLVGSDASLHDRLLERTRNVRL